MKVRVRLRAEEQFKPGFRYRGSSTKLVLQVKIASLTRENTVIIKKKSNSSLEGQTEVLIPERAAGGSNRTAGNGGEEDGSR